MTYILSDEQILAGYQKVAGLYPYTPSLSMWRAWEYAAYQSLQMQEPVLDLGCGDGRFFRLLWPELREIYGVDIDPIVVERANQSGIYRQVWQADAASLPLEPESMASVFANCSLEHIDQIATVFDHVYRVLRPDGTFIFSIVTDKTAEWFSLSTLVRELGEEALAQNLYDAWRRYHHFVNPFPVEHWCSLLSTAGFLVSEQIPIVPELTARLFLLIDGLWHVKGEQHELGQQIAAYLRTNPRFPTAFGGILQNILMLETNRSVGCGAVLVATKVDHGTNQWI